LAKSSASVSKYGIKNANFIDYKVLPLIVENNTKNPNIYMWQKWLVFLVDFVLNLFIFKLTISHVTYARMWLRSFFTCISSNYYMASITSGEMADCDWQRSTFSGPLFSCNGLAVHYVKIIACILKQNSKTNWKFEKLIMI
jgi:hypothetical protein